MEWGHTVIDTPHTLSQTYLSIGQISELVSEGPVINLFYDIVLIIREALWLEAVHPKAGGGWLAGLPAKCNSPITTNTINTYTRSLELYMPLLLASVKAGVPLLPCKALWTR